jgi:hypothetical protein
VTLFDVRRLLFKVIALAGIDGMDTALVQAFTFYDTSDRTSIKRLLRRTRVRSEHSLAFFTQ